MGIWPLGPHSYLRLPSPFLSLTLNKYHCALSWMYTCDYFALSNGPNKEFGQYQYFGQNVGIWSPGFPMHSVTTPHPHCFAITFGSNTIMLYRETNVYWLVYFALVSNGLNREAIWIIPTFGPFWVIYMVKKWVCNPRLPMYRVTSHCLLLLLKKYYHALSWIYNCGYISLSNGSNGTYLDNTHIWGHFWAKCAYLTPPGPNV